MIIVMRAVRGVAAHNVIVVDGDLQQVLISWLMTAAHSSACSWSQPRLIWRHT